MSDSTAASVSIAAMVAEWYKTAPHDCHIPADVIEKRLARFKPASDAALQAIADLVNISGVEFDKKHPKLKAELDAVGSDRWGEAIAEYASAALAAKPQAEPARVVVKPLVWVELEQDRGDGTTDLTGNHEAESVAGTYQTELGFGSDCYYWGVAINGEEIGHSFDDLDRAKAAAQADYERRILSAIAGQP